MSVKTAFARLLNRHARRLSRENSWIGKWTCSIVFVLAVIAVAVAAFFVMNPEKKH